MNSLKNRGIQKILAVFLTAALTLSGCASGSGGAGSSPASREESYLEQSAEETPGDADIPDDLQPSQMPATDREGNPIVVPDKIGRIISTAPSNTEILVGLGQTDRLVAIDKYSADIEGIPSELPQINFREPDAEALVELEPDLIIASGHNRQGGENPYALLEEAGICVAYIPSSTSVQGICDDISFIAQLTGAQEAGRAMVEDYKKQVREIEAVGASITEKKKVYFEIAPAPDLSSFGRDTFLNEFIELIGAENIFADQEGWISPSAESILERNPDVILTNVSYVDNAVDEIKAREGWNAVKAVSDGAVYLIDSNPASRPSQYSIKALRQIAHAVYPDLYADPAA